MNAEKVISKFHERGLSATPQRLAICEYVLSSKEHPTVDQTYKAVKKRHPTISLATIYQTLHLLADLGLLKELELNGRITRYDPNTSLHINVICKKCGAVEDYEGEAIDALWSKIVDGLGFEPVGERIEVYRYCNRCSGSAVDRNK